MRSALGDGGLLGDRTTANADQRVGAYDDDDSRLLADDAVPRPASRPGVDGDLRPQWDVNSRLPCFLGLACISAPRPTVSMASYVRMPEDQTPESSLVMDSLVVGACRWKVWNAGSDATRWSGRFEDGAGT